MQIYANVHGLTTEIPGLRKGKQLTILGCGPASLCAMLEWWLVRRGVGWGGGGDARDGKVDGRRLVHCAILHHFQLVHSSDEDNGVPPHLQHS